MAEVAAGALLLLIIGAGTVYVIAMFFLSAIAMADGEVDARHGHRHRDRYKGVLRWAYERGRRSA